MSDRHAAMPRLDSNISASKLPALPSHCGADNHAIVTPGSWKEASARLQLLNCHISARHAV
jgi:hypothetical protein